jgi:hypothetical protein
MTIPVLITGLLAWQWQLDGQRLNGILLLHLALASGSCIWLLHLALASGSCIWLLHLALASGSCIWWRDPFRAR